jgi:hypothetical protein
MNSAVNVSTGYSPHQLLYGIRLRQPMDMIRQAFDDAEQDFSCRLDAERSLAYAAIAMKNYYDKTHLHKWFDVGDYVYLRLGNGYDIHANQGLPRKLAQRFVGRFKVLERVGRLAYRLELPPTWSIHPVVSVEHLEPDPPGDDEWERLPAPAELPPIAPESVLRILQKRQRPIGRPRNDGTRAMRTEYLVRFRGRGSRDDQWIAVRSPGTTTSSASMTSARTSSEPSGRGLFGAGRLLGDPLSHVMRSPIISQS